MAATGGAIRDSINDINTALQAFVSAATDLANSFARHASTVIAELEETVDTEIATRADPTVEVQKVVHHLRHHIDKISTHIEHEANRIIAVLEA